MRIRFSLVGVVAGIGLALAACGSGNPTAAAHPTAGQQAADHQGAGQQAAVRIGQSSLGPILTDAQGRTLYAFVHDKNGTSTCGSECLATWPALVSTSAAAPGDGVRAGLLSKVDRTQGSEQVTYGQWPLYYYVGDQGPGDVDGEGVDGAWFALGADGKLVKPAS